MTAVEAGEKGQGSMRELMPQTAAWIDELREAFGRETIDQIVRAGMQGKGGFWVEETGPDGVVRTVGSCDGVKALAR